MPERRPRAYALEWVPPALALLLHSFAASGVAGQGYRDDPTEHGHFLVAPVESFIETVQALDAATMRFEWDVRPPLRRMLDNLAQRIAAASVQSAFRTGMGPLTAAAGAFRQRHESLAEGHLCRRAESLLAGLMSDDPPTYDTFMGKGLSLLFGELKGVISTFRGPAAYAEAVGAARSMAERMAACPVAAGAGRWTLSQQERTYASGATSTLFFLTIDGVSFTGPEYPTGPNVLLSADDESIAMIVRRGAR